MLWLACRKDILLPAQCYEMTKNSWMCRSGITISILRFIFFIRSIRSLNMNQVCLKKLVMSDFSMRVCIWQHVSCYCCRIICSLRSIEFKMDSLTRIPIQQFIIEYKCTNARCSHRWFCTLSEVIPMRTCFKCGGCGQPTNVVSGFLQRLQVTLFWNWRFVSENYEVIYECFFSTFLFSGGNLRRCHQSSNPSNAFHFNQIKIDINIELENCVELDKNWILNWNVNWNLKRSLS